MRYAKEVVPALMKHFNYTNVMAVPKLEKIVINMGLGEAVANAKIMDVAVGRTRPDRRTASGDDAGQEVDREFQTAPEHADRRRGHASRRTHV